jgi:hypothetical protein
MAKGWGYEADDWELKIPTGPPSPHALLRHQATRVVKGGVEACCQNQHKESSLQNFWTCVLHFQTLLFIGVKIKGPKKHWKNFPQIFGVFE